MKEMRVQSHRAQDSSVIRGRPSPTDPDIVGIFQDKDITPEERSARFFDFAGAYYMHKSVTSGNVEDLQSIPGTNRLISTSERMSGDELKEVTHPAGLERSEVGMHITSSEVFSEIARKAFFDDKMAGHFPMCRVDIIYGEHTLWPIINSMWKLQELRRKADEAGVKGRPMRDFIFPKANHFVSVLYRQSSSRLKFRFSRKQPHWDIPDETMRFFAQVLMS